MKKIGIVIIAHSRYKCFSKVLQNLKNCDLSDFEVCIFIDGPRSDKESKLVNKSAEYAKNFAASIDSKVCIYISRKNKGLQKNITESISFAFQTYESCIVLEDDILISNKALQFCRSNLIKYKDDPSVSSICLNNPVRSVISHNSFKSYRMTCWGWACWRSTWINMLSVESVRKKLDIMSDDSLHDYKLHVGYDSYNRLIDAVHNNRDIWACRWIFSQYIIGGKSLISSSNLSVNIGLNTNSENYSKSMPNIVFALYTSIVCSSIFPRSIIRVLVKYLHLPSSIEFDNLLLVSYFSSRSLTLFVKNYQMSPLKRWILALLVLLSLPLKSQLKPLRGFLK